MTTEELKQAILSKSFGGVMYDISENSGVRKLVENHENTARMLYETISENMSADGIEKGVGDFIKEVLDISNENEYMPV